MNFNSKLTLCTVLAGIMVSSTAYAGEVNINGFIRSAYDVTNSSAKYLELIDNHGSFGGTQAGITYSSVVNEQWSIAGQLHFRADEGELNIDWGIATFSVADSSKIIFGRQKYPLGLLSENVDIGLTYPWTRPPQELYRLELGDETGNFFIEGFDGIAFNYTTGDDWEFTVHPFVGDFAYKEAATKFQRKMLGLKLEVANEIVTLQMGYGSSELTINADPVDESKITTNFGAKLELDELLAYFEYVSTKVSNSDTFDSNASYLSVAYSFGKFQPVLTAAMLEGQKATNASIGALDQTSIAAGMAYHHSPSTVFKAQWKNIKPDDPTTAGLIGALPAGDTSVDVLSFTMDTVF